MTTYLEHAKEAQRIEQEAFKHFQLDRLKLAAQHWELASIMSINIENYTYYQARADYCNSKSTATHLKFLFKQSEKRKQFNAIH